MRERLGYPLLKTPWTVGEQPPVLEGKPASDYWKHVKLNKPVEKRRRRRPPVASDLLAGGGRRGDPGLVHRPRAGGPASARSSSAAGRRAAHARRGAHLRHAAAAGGAGSGTWRTRARTSPQRSSGPGAKAAFDEDGKPTKAAEKFAESARSSPSSSSAASTTPKGEYLSAQGGGEGPPRRGASSRSCSTPLCTASTSEVHALGRRGAAFARPVHWIVALLGGEVLPVVFGDVKSGRTTLRPPLPRPRTPSSWPRPADYEAALEKAHVMPDVAKRRALLVEKVQAAAKAAGGQLLEDDALVDQVTNLVELPNPVVGTFDERHLDLPPEVLVQEMKSHQRYFSLDGRAREAAAQVHRRLQHAGEGREAVPARLRARAALPPRRRPLLLRRGPQDAARRPRREAGAAWCGRGSSAATRRRWSASAALAVFLAEGRASRERRARSSARPPWPRRTSSPAWSASSPSCRA